MAMDSVPVGLVPAARPADVLPMVGWTTTDQFQTTLPIAAVLDFLVGLASSCLRRAGGTASREAW
jgi:hypothetical protein